MTMREFTFCILLCCVSAQAGQAKNIINLTNIDDSPIGKSLVYLQESDHPFAAQEAFEVFTQPLAESSYSAMSSDSAVLSFGIGSKPVWLYLSLQNTQNTPLKRNIFIDNIWIDKLDFYFFKGLSLDASYQLGDSYPFKQRLVDSRLFVVPFEFAPGITHLLIRVETLDTINLPIYVLTDQQLNAKTEYHAYSYGLLYGAIAALLIYNIILFFSLKDRRYFYYSVFLSFFLAMNFAYTGHGFKWLWPENTTWQMWCGSSLILLFNISGLAFAREFLELKQHFSRISKAIVYLCVLALCLYLFAALMANNEIALIISMVFTLLYPMLMVGLGLLSLKFGYQAAFYFLIGSISAAIGTFITALSVWGFIPFNDFTFRAVEIGMLIDAVLLALALAELVRESKHKKTVAESIAMLDPLTGLYNRRGLYSRIAPIWDDFLDKKQPVSAILLDIDRFKILNDKYGHFLGDQVLEKIAFIMKENARSNDIAVRWGGEELLIVLPNTSTSNAITIAERIRQQIAMFEIELGNKKVSVTASFGVVELLHETSVDELIKAADVQLYCAKNAGRNTVYAKQNT